MNDLRRIIHADGAALNNPVGQSSAAAVLIEDGDVVLRYGKRLGVGSCNVAEYNSLVLALRMAKDLGMEHVAIRMDSRLVVKQVLGEFKCSKDDLVPLRDQVQKMMKEFSSVDLQWVPREQNEAADQASRDSLSGLLEDVCDQERLEENVMGSEGKSQERVDMRIVADNETIILSDIKRNVADHLAAAMALSTTTRVWPVRISSSRNQNKS